ncbi:hypothetical protein [Xanthomonas translucens]|uniref:hypothetical protein n=1 Tax=Xanthomonas campestris pv. translucens TaxID=343 RepID=UPI00071E7F5D|nr:hypothetical protein [Xanthomonas translucens]KTF31995.1 hypothetical protein OZ12_18585 [Xanthomonas translucens pv. translucens]KWV12170.1 hypothetical protein ATB54_04175 [Xanthomonas translucens]MCS3360099.1 hypothetical protein [Xanthomonas translucens pv. translucens]MCS3374051.1 hypothetical protein [Xanthomonas translucens pv. translucens]MCT8274906.1 hypothetical protein [Xanthomonas translucens pv. translucens]
MGVLIYLVPAIGLWALTASVLAWVFFDRLRREQQEQASAQDTIERYQAALSQLKARAAASARELETLQQAYASLRQTLEAQTLEETQEPHAAQEAEERPPVPILVMERLDISAEIGTLLAHVARVARSIRRYSAYSRGHNAPESSSARYDLHWLSDCLHSLDQIGHALARGNVDTLTAACTELLSMYEQYLKDGSGYNSRDTFQRLSSHVPLADVTDAIRSIAAKASLAGQAQTQAGEPAHAASLA